ncbi:conserved exported hypothetical protein [Rhodospirillaceae bacterium LM-1]|nr:conserved exported hypothetical protein [Rhodospirillaceae bacterium LM-1]
MPARLPHPATWALLAMLAAQLLVWAWGRGMYANEEITPPPPPALSLKLAAMGDDQFLFRSLGLHLQNFGDTGGQVTPLADYDYQRLYGWFLALDGLDPLSDYVAVIAAQYYGLTPKNEDVRHVVAYLRAHAAKDYASNWRWLAHAVYLARHRMKDNVLALEVARELAGLPIPDLPPWTRAMPAYAMADLGEREAAIALLVAIMATDAKHLTPEEVVGMEKSIRKWQRLGEGGQP